MSLYDDLGVDQDATEADLKRAYREQAKRAHPDRGGSEDEFNKVNRAWMVLRDPEKRSRYDRTGEADGEPDNSYSVLSAMMGQALEEAIAAVQGRFETSDIVEIMAASTRDKLDTLKGEIAKGKKAVARFDRMLKRVRYKGGKTDLMSAIIKDKRGNLSDQLRALDRSKAGYESLIDLLTDYGWEVDEPEQMDLEEILGRASHAARAADYFDIVDGAGEFTIIGEVNLRD